MYKMYPDGMIVSFWSKVQKKKLSTIKLFKIYDLIGESPGNNCF